MLLWATLVIGLPSFLMTLRMTGCPGWNLSKPLAMLSFLSMTTKLGASGSALMETASESRYVPPYLFSSATRSTSL
jgi:hypothetical protein